MINWEQDFASEEIPLRARAISLFIHHMIRDRIRLHSVILPLLI